MFSLLLLQTTWQSFISLLYSFCWHFLCNMQIMLASRGVRWISGLTAVQYCQIYTFTAIFLRVGKNQGFSEEKTQPTWVFRVLWLLGFFGYVGFFIFLWIFLWFLILKIFSLYFRNINSDKIKVLKIAKKEKNPKKNISSGFFSCLDFVGFWVGFFGANPDFSRI